MQITENITASCVKNVTNSCPFVDATSLIVKKTAGLHLVSASTPIKWFSSSLLSGLWSRR